MDCDCGNTDIIINTRIAEMLEEFIKEERQSAALLLETFTDDRCKILNKNIKNKNNCYKLDRIGLLIRQQAYEKINDPFGWKYDSEKKPIHILYSTDLTDEENVNSILQAIHLAKPELFGPKGIIRKIYAIHFPERLNKFM